VVAGLTNVAKVAAGTANVAALDYSGNLWVWGDNTYGQLGMSATTYPAIVAPVQVTVDSIVACVAAAGGVASTASKVVDVAFGDKHLLVLTDDGRVFSCGGNRYGQLGYWTATLDTDTANAAFAEVFLQADPNSCSTAFPVAAMTANTTYTAATGTHVASASAGAQQTPYLAFDGNSGTNWRTNTGTYAATGAYAYTGAVTTALAAGGTLAGEWIQVQLPRQIALASTSITPSAVNTSSGAMTVLGSNDGSSWFPLGSSSGNLSSAATVTVVATAVKNKFYFFRVVFTAATSGTASYVSAASVVLTGGYPLEAQPVAVCCGLNHSIVQVSNNTIRTFGRDESGQLGAPVAAGRSAAGYRWLPAKPTAYADVVNVAASQDVTYVEAYLPDVANALTVPRMRGYGKYEMARGPGKWFVGGGSANSHTMFANDQGKLYGWGNGGSYQLGNGGSANVNTSTLVSTYGSLATRGVTKGACGNAHTVALASDGTLHAWGANSSGQLGITTTGPGNTTILTIPTLINSGTGLLAGSRTATAVACGGYYTVALASDGTLHAWGYNANGELGMAAAGPGNTTNLYVPTMINGGTGKPGVANVIAFACGINHSIALDANNLMYAWGYNSNGQLGTSTNGTVTAYVPTLIYNGYGNLGYTPSSVFACGYLHTVALSTNAYLFSWGNNTYGQTGTSTGTTGASIYLPTMVYDNTGLLAGARNASAVACGYYHTVALATDGTVHAWGYNAQGQLGIAPTGPGNTTNLSVPTLINNGTGQLAGSRTAAAIACGQFYTLALATDGTLHTWGQNTSGQLGTGDLINCYIPTLINLNALAQTTLFLNFTGQHRCFVDGHGVDTLPSLEGRIVCASKNQYVTTSGPSGGDTAFKVDADAITTNDALPVVALSTKPRDKSAFGVVSLVVNFEDLDGADPDAALARLREQGDARAEINSVGEGAMWVCDAARDAVTGHSVPLESGDLVTTSAVPGYGMRQDDDIVRGYTVAKITMDCDFNPPLVPVRRLAKDALGNNLVDPATGKPVFEVVTETERTVTAPDGTTTVEVLDPPVAMTKPAYRLRYLRAADGSELADRAAYDAAVAAGEAVNVAAFVGVTYHC
jgi:alpha-tubulin suppressor-like RCC1 family protein